MPILITNVKDRLTWTLTTHGQYSVKLDWANNDSIRRHPKAKFISSIWTCLSN